MLTKEQFINRLSFLMDYSEKVDKFDSALQEFAPSDFTGFYDESLIHHLLTTLEEDMGEDQSESLISWWLYDCPKAGENPEYAKVWDGDKDGSNCEEYDVSTPSKLYDYLFIKNTKTPSKMSVKMCMEAQDNGVRFTLDWIDDFRAKNAKASNSGWEERDALLSTLEAKIKNEYFAETGASRDFDLIFNKPTHIISTLDKES